MNKETKTQETQADQADQETQVAQVVQVVQVTQETQETQETQVAQETQEKSFYDETLDTVEKVPGVIGEYTGKVARLLFSPLYYIHKHTTAPFIEQFKNAFNEDK